MTASDNLSSQLFHGTNAKLRKGDTILPRSHPDAPSGLDTNWHMNGNRGTRAYSVEHLDTAKFFGKHAAMYQRHASDEPTPQAHVYEVEPLGETKLRNLNRSKKKNSQAVVEHSTEAGFRVKKKVWSSRVKDWDNVHNRMPYEE